MGKLKDRMLELMTIRNYSKKTIQAYVSHITAYTRYFGKSPAEMGEEEMRKYLFYLKVKSVRVGQISMWPIMLLSISVKKYWIEILNWPKSLAPEVSGSYPRYCLN